MSLDISCPKIPDEIDNPTFDSLVVSDVWNEICAEFSNPSLSGRAHNAGTYERSGCRGPVCRKANREHYRRNAKGGVFLRPEDDRIYDPVVEYFHTVIKHRIRAAQQEILNELKGLE